jgi:D-alanyl-D-alanine carboxypeptidase (penicillin-binding protein 5/6)
MGTNGTVRSAGTTPLPKVVASSWVVADATTGVVLAAHDPHGRFYPASTLKTLTALTVLPALDKTATYVGQDADARVEGTRVGIVVGATYTIDDLFHGLFLASGNDAAVALAHAYGGVAKTVDAMNATAHELQADDTLVVNPSGLDAAHQLTSAYDLALIARAGLARDDFRTYTSTRRYQFPGKMPKKPGGGRPTFQIQNQNRLLMHGFAGTIGVKTGYTTDAGRTFVAAAERRGHVLVVALMHIAEPSEDAAAALLTWGFHNLSAPGVGTLVDPLPAAPSPSAVPTSSMQSTPQAAGVGGGSGSAGKAWVGVAVAAALALTAGSLRLGRRGRFVGPRRRPLPPL